ncbi:hypothetical protein [Aquimarina sediminis]|uniref:hypothetical protein n=1 Tax=Aquimarina sediminis TaxID=2070536 RepID=UPI000CA01EA4|nr:hypothetical protein [Aquimarina sediminis]
MNEICFSLIIRDEVVIDEDYMIDDFISFAESSHVSIGGNVDNGFCFCLEKGEISLSIKNEFIKYLSTNYSKVFRSIIFKKFNERLDEFEEYENVRL